MRSIFEYISKHLSDTAGAPEHLRRGYSYTCHCGRPVFFRNSQCVACGSALGYETENREVCSILPGKNEGTWILAGENENPNTYRRCENYHSPAGCNWLIPVEETSTFCIACRLNRTIPDLTDTDNQRYWRSIEIAKRRLVAQLLGLGLPVKAKETEDPAKGLMFDFLRSPPNGPRVLTGHADGLIVINIEEADDAKREKIRSDMHEPYRTLLGHFRHEVGHYYWDRLIAGTAWHEPFRALFGDERSDYAAALKANYEKGPPPDWAQKYISTYASTHPWEDWAESWAHYLHLVDSLGTAIGYGLTGEDVVMEVESFTLDDLYMPDHPDAPNALLMVKSWLQLITVLNELARSMGQPDFYPFVMSRPVLRKLHFIQLVVKGESPPAAIS